MAELEPNKELLHEISEANKRYIVTGLIRHAWTKELSDRVDQLVNKAKSLDITPDEIAFARAQGAFNAYTTLFENDQKRIEEGKAYLERVRARFAELPPNSH